MDNIAYDPRRHVLLKAKAVFLIGSFNAVWPRLGSRWHQQGTQHLALVQVAEEVAAPVVGRKGEEVREPAGRLGARREDNFAAGGGSEHLSHGSQGAAAAC